MSAYFVSVFGICVCVGALGLLSYNDKNAAQRCALGVILLYVVLSPVARVIGEIDSDDFNLERLTSEIEIGSGYSEVTEAAVCDGICRATSAEFSFSDEDISVKLYGFDFEEMRAEKVRVLLSGRAALSDTKAVKKYIDEMGVGECEIEIRLGQ